MYIDDVDNPPGAGRGLFALHSIHQFAIIGIYTGGEQLTAKDIGSPYDTTYTATHESLIRDGLNHKTGRVTCDVAMINDSLDPSLHNCDFYVHPDYPSLLLVIATRDIAPDQQLFIAYGADYWCHDKYPLAVQIAAIKCYNVNLEQSLAWQALQNYSTLCAHFQMHDNSIPTHSAPQPLADPVPHTVRVKGGIFGHNVNQLPITQVTNLLFNALPGPPSVPKQQPKSKSSTTHRKRKRSATHITTVDKPAKQQRILWPARQGPSEPKTCPDSTHDLPGEPLNRHSSVDNMNIVNSTDTTVSVDVTGISQFVSSDSLLAFPFNLLAAAAQTNIATRSNSPNVPKTLSYDKHVVDS